MLPHRPAVRSAVAALAALLASSLQASTAAQQASDSSPAFVTVSGTVYDSLNVRPLPGALVQLAPSDLRGSVLSSTTDSTGSFRMSGVRPGEYLVGFTHPSLDSLGLDVPPLKLKVDGGTPLRLSLAIPTALAVRAQICPATQPTDSSGVMLGFLRDADSGLHLDSGRVALEWTEVRVTKDGNSIAPERRSVSSNSTSAGWYALCGVPTAGPIAARAEVGGNTTGFIDVEVPPRGVLHRDFSIPRGAAAVAVAPMDTGVAGESGVAPLRHGRARLTGTVRDQSGKLLHDARLLVWGSDITASTDDDGHFSLAGLPAGTQTLEARQIGFAPKRVAVDLSSDRVASVTVTLDKVADVLSEVTVYGDRSALSRRLDGFRQRMRAGWGHYVTRADIEKRAPLRLTDMLRGIPGILVKPVGAFDYQLTSTRNDGCRPAIFLDGHQVIRPPHGRLGNINDGDIAPINDLVWMDWVIGIEIYSSAMFAPAEFRSPGNCGVVLIWTSPDANVLDRAGGGGQ